jgi:uncharacterized protein (TIGR03067 family)
MPLRHLQQVAFVLAIFAALGAIAAQSADPAIQGNWVVVGAEHNGKPTTSLNGGTMTVTESRFEIHTAGGNLLTGDLRLDRTKTPAEMNLIHDNGTRWEAIYEASDNGFKINYVAAGTKDKRPASFSTSPDTEALLVLLKRKIE